MENKILNILKNEDRLMSVAEIAKLQTDLSLQEVEVLVLKLCESNKISMVSDGKVNRYCYVDEKEYVYSAKNEVSTNKGKIVSAVLFGLLGLKHVINIILSFINMRWWVYSLLEVLCAVSVILLFRSTILAINPGVPIKSSFKKGCCATYVLSTLLVFAIQFISLGNSLGIIFYIPELWTGYLIDIVCIAIVYLATFKLDKWIK